MYGRITELQAEIAARGQRQSQEQQQQQGEIQPQRGQKQGQGRGVGEGREHRDSPLKELAGVKGLDGERLGVKEGNAGGVRGGALGLVVEPGGGGAGAGCLRRCFG